MSDKTNMFMRYARSGMDERQVFDLLDGFNSSSGKWTDEEVKAIVKEYSAYWRNFRVLMEFRKRTNEHVQSFNEAATEALGLQIDETTQNVKNLHAAAKDCAGELLNSIRTSKLVDPELDLMSDDLDKGLEIFWKAVSEASKKSKRVDKLRNTAKDELFGKDEDQEENLKIYRGNKEIFASYAKTRDLATKLAESVKGLQAAKNEVNIAANHITLETKNTSKKIGKWEAKPSKADQDQLEKKEKKKKLFFWRKDKEDKEKVKEAKEKGPEPPKPPKLKGEKFQGILYRFKDQDEYNAFRNSYHTHDKSLKVNKDQILKEQEFKHDANVILEIKEHSKRFPPSKTEHYIGFGVRPVSEPGDLAHDWMWANGPDVVAYFCTVRLENPPDTVELHKLTETPFKCVIEGHVRRWSWHLQAEGSGRTFGPYATNKEEFIIPTQAVTDVQDDVFKVGVVAEGSEGFKATTHVKVKVKRDKVPEGHVRVIFSVKSSFEDRPLEDCSIVKNNQTHSPFKTDKKGLAELHLKPDNYQFTITYLKNVPTHHSAEVNIAKKELEGKELVEKQVKLELIEHEVRIVVRDGRGQPVKAHVHLKHPETWPDRSTVERQVDGSDVFKLPVSNKQVIAKAKAEGYEDAEERFKVDQDKPVTITLKKVADGPVIEGLVLNELTNRGISNVMIKIHPGTGKDADPTWHPVISDNSGRFSFVVHPAEEKVTYVVTAQGSKQFQRISDAVDITVITKGKQPVIKPSPVKVYLKPEILHIPQVRRIEARQIMTDKPKVKLVWEVDEPELLVMKQMGMYFSIYRKVDNGMLVCLPDKVKILPYKSKLFSFVDTFKDISLTKKDFEHTIDYCIKVSHPGKDEHNKHFLNQGETSPFASVILRNIPKKQLELIKKAVEDLTEKFSRKNLVTISQELADDVMKLYKEQLEKDTTADKLIKALREDKDATTKKLIKELHTKIAKIMLKHVESRLSKPLEKIIEPLKGKINNQLWSTLENDLKTVIAKCESQSDEIAEKLTKKFMFQLDIIINQAEGKALPNSKEWKKVVGENLDVESERKSLLKYYAGLVLDTVDHVHKMLKVVDEKVIHEIR